MFVQTKEFEPENVQRAQVCVFGSGPAGMTIAVGLAEKGLDVILVEAGSLYYEDESQEFYKGTVIGDNYFDLSEARLRMFGGTSNHWGGYCIPLEAHDYERHPDFEDSSWPIGAGALAPYLDKACGILEIPSEFSDIKFTPQVRKTNFQYSTVNFGSKYQKFCEKSSKIRVFLNSCLIGLLPKGGSVRSAQIKSRGGTTWSVEASSYVLCLGGIENSRILLWMNEKTNGALIGNSDTLGRYWMEHPHAELGGVLFTNPGAEFWRDSKASFSLSKEVQWQKGILNATLLVEQETYKGSKEMVSELLCIAPNLGRRFVRLLGKEDLICGARVRSHWEQAPVEANRVALGESRDSFGIPRPELHWRKIDADRRTILETVRVFAEDIARHDRGRMRVAPWIIYDEPIPDEYTMAGWHHMGGTRMSDNPGEGIVDRNLKVHGLENLYVGGSSVFPSGGYANPTLTIVQLSLRLVDHLTVNK